MTAQDWLNGLGGLICVIKGDCGHEVMEDMGFDDPVHEVPTNKAKFTVDGGCGAAREIPAASFVMRKGRIGVLKEGDPDCGKY